jgi:NTP pyrophosphatase (non-canonical NTP hydrolase)
MVEAAELAEVFQWMTPEESREAHLDAVSKQRIGEEIADVLLYLLQVADHTEVDVEQAVKDKLVRNARKYPAKRAVAVVEPIESQLPDTHILLDYENVQPTEVELRAMVPEATQVWVFHGPHQKQVEQRFASFGTSATMVPISKTGKNALRGFWAVSLPSSCCSRCRCSASTSCSCRHRCRVRQPASVPGFPAARPPACS